ncbi:MAG: peptidylprolyl isomerase [Phycisphaerae bacterium]|nr:peptidylprolyl isomerase [Phycisphaerae bacterium]
MRSYCMITVFSVVFAVIIGGCRFKEREYGKFTEEEISKMPYAKVEGLPEPSGGVTLSIMGETITANEIVNNEPVLEALTPMAILAIYVKRGGDAEYGKDDMKNIYDNFYEKAKPVVSQIVMSKVSDVLVYKLAKKNAPSNIDEILEKAAEKEANKHLAKYGHNRARAESAFKAMKLGISDWKDFTEFQKKFIMTQMYISKKIKRDIPISHGDMVARYNEYIAENDPNFIWDSRLKMRVIDIQPDKLTSDEIKVENGESRKQAALRKGKELLERIKAGEDFGKLAETNSHGVGKNTGGLWPDWSVGSLAEPLDVLEKAAEKMEAGDDPDVIETDGHVFIMKLEDKRVGGTVAFTEVQGRIESELRLIAQREEYNKLFTEIVEQANVKDLDVFTDYCLKQAFEIITKLKANG